MNESNKLTKQESPDYDDYQENQLFPVYDDEQPRATRIRWLILLLGFFGVMCAYVTRLNLSITIVAMTKLPENDSILIDTSIKQKVLANSLPRLEWDAKTQGLILGSFFWTYGLLQIIGGRFAELFGSKLISLVIIFSSGIISFLTPFIARLGVLPMILCRALLGIAQSATYPVYYCLISKWFPETEQSKALAFLGSGACIGTIITSEFAGYLCESDLFGWPFVFYFSGALCIVWSLFWSWLSASEPRLHSYVNKQEMLFIERDKTAMGLKHQKATPWKAILTSKAIWSVIAAKFGVDYVFWLIMLQLPQYLHNVLHFRIHQNGLINCSLNLMLVFSTIIGGFLSDSFVRQKLMNKTKLRKSFQLFAVLGTNLCLILITVFQETSSKAVVVILILSMFFYGFNTGGDVPIVIDMTEDFPATVFGLMNGVSSICGFLAPSLTGYIINKNVNGFDTWSKVFYLAVFINTIGLVIFLIYASAEPLFKERTKKNQFDLDTMNGEREDSLLLAKKKQLFNNNNFDNLNNNNLTNNLNGKSNLAFKNDEDI